MAYESFSKHEREGWQRNAAVYDEIDLPLTRQGFAPLLDSIGNLNCRRVLELASGTGHLATEAVSRGATVVGIDVAPAMVALAKQNAPQDAEFHVGNAEALAFDAGEFDAVVSNFGFLHFGDPQKVMSESARVLRPGGVCAFTVWRAPEQGNEFLSLVVNTVKEHSSVEVELPPAPPMFALADTAICKPMMHEAGFDDVQAQVLPIEMPLRGPETSFVFLEYGAVRTRMLFEAQTPSTQARIRDALYEATSAYLKRKRAVPCPAAMVVGRRKA